MKIVIKISNLITSLNIQVDDEKGMFLLNNKAIDVDIEKFVSSLTTILASWQQKMVDESVIDGEEYSVKLRIGTKTRTYIGKNKFPSNYRDFKKLIEGVTKC